MRKVASGLILASLLASGCIMDFDVSFLEPKSPVSIVEEGKAPSQPAPPVTMEQVNEKNAAEKARSLADEIKREENADRMKNGEMTDKPKLAIP
jgi:hypothetical protein